MPTFEVTAQYDPEGKCWIAKGVNVLGLVTASDSLDELISSLDLLVPEMLVSNRIRGAHKRRIKYRLIIKRTTSRAPEGAIGAPHKSTLPTPPPAGLLDPVDERPFTLLNYIAKLRYCGVPDSDAIAYAEGLQWLIDRGVLTLPPYNPESR
jgi:hypothetical protein